MYNHYLISVFIMKLLKHNRTMCQSDIIMTETDAQSPHGRNLLSKFYNLYGSVVGTLIDTTMEVTAKPL